MRQSPVCKAQDWVLDSAGPPTRAMKRWATTTSRLTGRAQPAEYTNGSIISLLSFLIHEK